MANFTESTFKELMFCLVHVTMLAKVCGPCLDPLGPYLKD